MSLEALENRGGVHGDGWTDRCEGSWWMDSARAEARSGQADAGTTSSTTGSFLCFISLSVQGSLALVRRCWYMTPHPTWLVREGNAMLGGGPQ